MSTPAFHLGRTKREPDLMRKRGARHAQHAENFSNELVTVRPRRASQDFNIVMARDRATQMIVEL